eukprot:108266-Prymnesium_polylepis.1
MLALIALAVASSIYQPAYDEADQQSLKEMTSPSGVWFSQTDRAQVLEAYRRLQEPDDCATARYLVIEDWQGQTGMGFSFITLHTMLLQAMWERRTVVFASALLPNATWRWCDREAQDFSCFFEPWSSCEAHLATQRYLEPNI